MREKIYANYKVNKPKNIFIGFFIFSVITFILGILSIWIENFNGEALYLPALAFFYISFSYRDRYLSNKHIPIIYFNEDELIVTFRRTIIIQKSEIKKFEINKKRYLKFFIKDKDTIYIDLYYLTYRKIDYVEEMLNKFLEIDN